MDALWRATSEAPAARVVAARCCTSTSVRVLCRKKDVYDAKCGFAFNPVMIGTEPCQLPLRYFDDVSSSLTNTFDRTVVAAGEGGGTRHCGYSCTYQMTASCEQPGGSVTSTRDVDGGDCIDTWSGSATASGAMGWGCGYDVAGWGDLVLSDLQALINYPVHTMRGNSIDDPECDWTGQTYGATPDPAPDAGCVTYSVSYSHEETAANEDWSATETAEASGTIAFCGEWTTARLRAAVEMALAGEPWGEYFEGACCAESQELDGFGGREATGDYVTLIALTAVEVLFEVSYPCTGGVRVSYTLAKYRSGEEEPYETTPSFIDNPSGPIAIDPPTGNERICIIDVSAALI